MPKPNCTEEISPEIIDFGRLGRRVVEGRFDGGSMTSDGGVMLLGETDRKLGLIEAAARCIADPRNPLLIKHAVRDMLRQRVYGLALGWEDLSDHSALRMDVAAPMVVDDEAVRLAVIDKLGWIKRQRARFSEQPRQSKREMVNGESHYFLGQRYRLRVHEHEAPARVAVRGIASLDLFVRPGTGAEQREAVLLNWYREQLKVLIPPLLEKWQPLVGVQASHWGIKKMKTKWGSCNPTARRLWFNLELAKKPMMCLEYIVVHELVHLLERNHSERFTALMDGFMPNWRACRETLNSGVLGHEVWEY